MAVRKIETTIALSGEQQFKRAMSDAAREIRVQETALKALSAAYENNGDKAAMLTGKQSLLKQQIAQQEQIVQALKSRFDKFSADPEKNFREIQSLSIEYNAATARLEKYKKALSSTDREIEELGRDAIKAGRQIEEGIGDGAREAENELTDLMATMQDSLSAIQSNTAVTAIKTVWDMASGAYNAVDGFVSGTVDYRRQLSFLELNADENGFDFSDIKTKLIEVTTVTGDASSSIETLSNLMAVPGIDTNTLTRAIEGLGGAVISFPETMKFESLADSLQETLASGTATGQFAELLNRLGVDVTEFNTALANSPTAAGDLEIALAYLAAGGLNDVYNKWQKTNEEMSDALKTQAELDDELAEFAGTLEKYVTTPVKKIAVDAMAYINDIVALAQEKGLEVAGETVADDLIIPEETATEWDAETAFSTKETNQRILENNLSMRNALIKAAKRLIFGEEPGGGIRFGEPEGDPYEAGAETAQQFAAGFEEWLDPTTWGEGKEVTSLQVIGQRSMDDVLAGIDLDAYYKEMNGAGKEGGAELMEGLEEGSEGSAEAGKAAGAAFGQAYAEGLTSQVSYVAASAGALAAAAAAAARAVSAPSVGVGGGLNLALNIDGKTFARATAPYMSGELAAEAQ